MVTLIGMGSGKWEALSAQAQQAVRSAGLVFGAKRLLAGLPADCTARQFALYQPADILETLAQNPGQDAAVLYSGDTGFYSGASGLLTPLRALGIPARVYPGVSSIQMLSAALGRPWQDWKLVSAHGCACDPVAECMMNRSVFFLTGGTETPASLCQKLTDAGMGEAHGVVGENLGTEAETIRYGSAAELAGQSFAPLSVLLVENFDLPQLRAPGFPDESFIRSEVPMTKQEVRAAALAKLAVMPTDTPGMSSRSSISAGPTSKPESSRPGAEGTVEGAVSSTRRGRDRQASARPRTPSMPRTLAISWGSAHTVVVPQDRAT